MDFSNHYLQGSSTSFSGQTEENAEILRFFQNYEYIQKQVKLGVYKDDDTLDTRDQSELEHNRISHEDFHKAGLRNLFWKT